MSMLLRVPMPNSSPYLTKKIKTPLVSQVSEITDQIGDGMLVCCFAMSLESSDCLCGPSDVVGFIRHAFRLN